jgi:hypothetical protein
LTAVLLDLAWVRADYASLGDTLPRVAFIAVLVLLGVAAVATIVAATRGQLRIAVMAFCLTAGALVVAIALARQGAQAVIVARVMGIISFGFVIAFAAAAGLAFARDSRAARAVAVACAAVLLACTAAAAVDVVQNGTNGVKWDTVASTIEHNAQPGDELIYYPIATKYGVDPYLAPGSPWRTQFNGAWPKDDVEAQQNFAKWTAGKSRVWFVFYAITGVDMPMHDRWFMQRGLCRVMGDPTASLGVIEYQAATTGC